MFQARLCVAQGGQVLSNEDEAGSRSQLPNDAGGVHAERHLLCATFL
jgi:hypothetical protein